MNRKSTLLLTIVIIVSLLITIVSTAFAYFATLSGSSEDNLNITSTTNGPSSTFLAMGEPVSLSISLSAMSESQIDVGYQAKTTSNTNMKIIYGSSKNDNKVSCTYDLVFIWEEDSDKYLSGTDTPPTSGLKNVNDGREFTITVGNPVYTGDDIDKLNPEDLTQTGMEETNIYYTGTCSDEISTTEMDCLKNSGTWTIDEEGIYANQMVLVKDAVISATSVYNPIGYCSNNRYDNPIDCGKNWVEKGGGIIVEWPISITFYNLSLDQTPLAGKKFAGHVEARNISC